MNCPYFIAFNLRFSFMEERQERDRLIRTPETLAKTDNSHDSYRAQSWRSAVLCAWNIPHSTYDESE